MGRSHPLSAAGVAAGRRAQLARKSARPPRGDALRGDRLTGDPAGAAASRGPAGRRPGPRGAPRPAGSRRAQAVAWPSRPGRAGLGRAGRGARPSPQLCLLCVPLRPRVSLGLTRLWPQRGGERKCAETLPALPFPGGGFRLARVIRGSLGLWLGAPSVAPFVRCGALRKEKTRAREAPRDGNSGLISICSFYRQLVPFSPLPFASFFGLDFPNLQGLAAQAAGGREGAASGSQLCRREVWRGEKVGGGARTCGGRRTTGRRNRHLTLCTFSEPIFVPTHLGRALSRRS